MNTDNKPAIRKTLAALAVFAIFWGVLAASAPPALAAPAVKEIAVPKGQTSFSIDVAVNEETPFASLEFALTISDESALALSSFTKNPAFGGAMESPFATKDGKRYFGLLSGSNALPAGPATAGTLNFTGYVGDAPVSVAIVQMKVIRLDGDKKAYSFEKEYPDAFSIKRAEAAAPPPVPPVTPGPGSAQGGSGPGAAQPAPASSPAALVTLGDESAPLSAGAVALDFDDVKAGDWFYVDVAYVYARRIMVGVGGKLFAPNAPLTRGMLVTIVGKLNNIDITKYPSCAFSDVPDDKYYAPYVAWAQENAIAQGVGDNRFEPERHVTRQEIAAVLARYAEFAKLALPAARDYPAFGDEAGIADWAKGSVEALCKAGVINGKPGDVFDPRGAATRAEAAAMARRFLEAAGG